MTLYCAFFGKAVRISTNVTPFDKCALKIVAFQAGFALNKTIAICI
jgi:hypothetical protein